MLNSTIYVSVATRKLSDHHLVELGVAAAAKNHRLEITGYLHSSYGLFFQYLEGPADALTVLMDEIIADDRHSVKTVIDFGQREKRLFRDWAMRLVTADDLLIGDAEAEAQLESSMLSICETGPSHRHVQHIHDLVLQLAQRELTPVSG